eukprot:2312018-Amphidinium_carterae.1
MFGFPGLGMMKPPPAAKAPERCEQTNGTCRTRRRHTPHQTTHLQGGYWTCARLVSGYTRTQWPSRFSGALGRFLRHPHWTVRARRKTCQLPELPSIGLASKPGATQPWHLLARMITDSLAAEDWLQGALDQPTQSAAWSHRVSPSSPVRPHPVPNSPQQHLTSHSMEEAFGGFGAHPERTHTASHAQL